MPENYSQRVNDSNYESKKEKGTLIRNLAVFGVAFSIVAGGMGLGLKRLKSNRKDYVDGILASPLAISSAATVDIKNNDTVYGIVNRVYSGDYYAVKDDVEAINGQIENLDKVHPNDKLCMPFPYGERDDSDNIIVSRYYQVPSNASIEQIENVLGMSSKNIAMQNGIDVNGNYKDQILKLKELIINYVLPVTTGNLGDISQFTRQLDIETDSFYSKVFGEYELLSLAQDNGLASKKIDYKGLSSISQSSNLSLLEQLNPGYTGENGSTATVLDWKKVVAFAYNTKPEIAKKVQQSLPVQTTQTQTTQVQTTQGQTEKIPTTQVETTRVVNSSNEGCDWSDLDNNYKFGQSVGGMDLSIHQRSMPHLKVIKSKNPDIHFTINRAVNFQRLNLDGYKTAASVYDEIIANADELLLDESSDELNDKLNVVLNAVLDPTFVRFCTESKEIGMPMGVYFLPRCQSEIGAKVELLVLEKALNKIREQGIDVLEMGLSLDIENADGGDIVNRIAEGDKDTLKGLEYMVRTLEENNFYTMIYTDFDKYNRMKHNLEDLDCALWIARYRSGKEISFTNHSPSQSVGNGVNYGALNIYQFSKRCLLNGYSEHVDIDACYVNIPEITKSKGLNKLNNDIIDAKVY